MCKFWFVLSADIAIASQYVPIPFDGAPGTLSWINSLHDPYNYFGRILVSSECWFLGVHRIIDRRAQLESSLNAFLKQINACSLHSLAESQPNTEIKTEYFIHPKSLDTCYAYDYYEWLQSKLYYHKHGFFIIWITI